jgi:exodeoxyribonuclease-1
VPRRDRPAQFAGLRTDEQLNEIGTPVMLHCQPPRDTLPDPESCLLTGITPQHCAAHGVPEHAFADAVLAELAAPGTIGVGYNSIRFDDEVTRFLLWRNLQDPYAREWQNGCSRWDLLDVLRAAYALRPGGIEWPRHDDGRPSFKLEHLTAANGLAHESAHDALSDVRATVALARKLKAAQPRLWDFCVKLRHKHAVVAEMGVGRPFLHVSGMYGPERGCLALVWPLAPHPSNRNEVIVWDLAHDPAELWGLNAATVRERLFTRADALPEGVARLPIKTLHINKSPVVVANLKTLAPEMAERWGLDGALGLRHAAACEQQAHRLAGLWPEVYERPDVPTEVDVDQDLYGGFLSNDDRRALERLRRLPPEELAHKQPAFADPRLGELLFRYRARNFPATLGGAEQQRWQAHCAARLHQGQGGGLTLAAFQERVDTLADAADERGQALLGELMDWAEQIAPEEAVHD